MCKYYCIYLLTVCGLTAAAAQSRNGTTENMPPANDGIKNRVAPDGCPYLAPGRTTEPTGIKSWDKCLEYQMQLVYPCEESPNLGKVRRDYCRHNATELAPGPEFRDAKHDEFPHMVLLGFGQNTSSVRWMFGGTLISDRFILTVAGVAIHYQYGPMTFASVGSLKPPDNAEAWQRVYRVKHIIRHPDFDPKTRHNNIALIETDPIQLGQSIVPACLDVFGGDRDRAVSISWDFIRMRDYLGNTLGKVTLAKFTDRECSDDFPRAFHYGPFHSATQICYGDHDNFVNYCRGDSGGCLAILNHRLHCMYTVIGINSIAACSDTGMANWFTKVSQYVPWIESKVWP